MIAPRHPLLIAAQHVVRKMGGNDIAARHLGKSVHTMRHELQEDYDGAKLGLLDACMLSQAAADTRIAAAFAMECGGTFVPLPDLPEEGDGADTMRHVSTLVKEFGDVLSEVSSRAADGDISDNDLAALQRESLEMMAALQGLMSHLTHRNAAGKPREATS